MIAREIGRVAWDRLGRRAGLPRTIDEVDAAYLTRLLGARVAAVHPVDRTAGTTDRARLRVVSPDGDLPDSVFVKIAPTKTVTRLFTNLAGLGRHEVGFYRDVRPRLDIETPMALGLDHDPASKRFVVVLDDLTSRGVRFTDTIRGVGVDEAAAVVDVLARLHAPFWGHTGMADGSAGWPITNSGDPMLGLVRRMLPVAARRLSRRDPALVPTVGARILARYADVATELDEGTHTILHGDPHPGNVYLIGERGGDVRAGLLDWQVLRRGNGARDLAYFLVLTLEPDHRRADGEALVARYRQELAAAGGPTLDPAALAIDVRRMVAYAYTSAVFTAAFAGLQDAPIAQRGLEKCIAALADLDTAEALRSV